MIQLLGETLAAAATALEGIGIFLEAPGPQ